MTQVKELAHAVGIRAPYGALGMPSSRFYRAEKPLQPKLLVKTERPTPPRALTAVEKERERRNQLSHST